MLAIVILNWNGLADTITCIESLQKSDLSATKIYVVDNGSANEEAVILQQRFPFITVMPQKENEGFCRGNNIGIQQALNDNNDYVLLLNNDTIIPPEAINIVLAEFIKLPDAGAICPIILNYPEQTEEVGFGRAMWDVTKAQFAMNPDGLKVAGIQHTAPWLTEFSNGCCMLTSAKVLRQAGVLDERYFAYYDEADWCRRIEKLGYKSYVTPAAGIYHVKHTAAFSKVSMYLFTRNRLLWMREHLPLKTRLKSFLYLNKEFLWHLFNYFGWVTGAHTRVVSKAYLIGIKDFRLRRFGKWSNRLEPFLTGRKVA
jgi:GT2 family glycosyltransferase